MDKLHLMSVFVAVVDCTGFAGAARKLSMSPPAVTRAINELEQALGVRLLTRTTRIVRVTEAGARYADDCRRILGEIHDADESASGTHAAPRGKLQVTAPVLFGGRFVMPIVTQYLQRYPDVTASCLFLDRVVNLLEEGMDVAVRIGDLPDSSMQAIRVGAVRRVICAAPQYLQEMGVPLSGDDLAGHRLISSSGISTAPEWKLMEQGTARTIKIHPRLNTSSNDSAITAAVAGFGLTRLLSYQIADQLQAGTLVTVLDACEPPMLPINLLHREGRQASQRVRAFLDMAIENLRSNPALQASAANASASTD